MSDSKAPIGSVGWFDLTVENADDCRDFYKAVVGWKSVDLSIGDYSDYVMSTPEEDKPVAGVCHARGGNSGLPPQWLMYVHVENMDASLEACTEQGGKIVSPVRIVKGHGKYGVIQDPAGAVLALFEQE